jgi:hypothetical protein
MPSPKNNQLERGNLTAGDYYVPVMDVLTRLEEAADCALESAKEGVRQGGMRFYANVVYWRHVRSAMRWAKYVITPHRGRGRPKGAKDATKRAKRGSKRWGVDPR